ncbi:Adaptor for signal transduction [Linnemannia schmuckeri]|uniref:Adaptor for signal transduction n=1 Tax=Linnemannia schmuckeri TaxID=64567 RepID=A0A9P5RZA2_9FUNG|nr:Adaptor for signal transduction [Linnemannia schmuckeri]
MTATVKAWHRDDCRRLSIDIEQIQYQDLKKKLQNTFQLENEFTVKYADMDGDLCTIAGTEEFEDMINSDLVKERKATLRLQIIPNSRRPSILHRRDSSDQSGGESKGSSRGSFDSEYADSDMLEILRDISLFICARGMDRHGAEHAESALADLPPGASSWVSAGKNLITPKSAQNYQRLNYARAARAKFPSSNGTDLLNGLDPHVYNWTVETTAQWLTTNGYEDSVQSFKENDITGDVLLDLTHDTLKDMGMASTGRRIRLLKMIAELRIHVADLTLQEATDEAQAQEALPLN